jgi:hypothetical protein
MTVYYVRKSGSDSNNGTSPATAWATIGKALGSGSPVTGGDIVYIGAGVYRETVTIAITPSSEVRIVGDVSGFYTGDGGVVRMSRYTSGDNVAPNTGNAALLSTSNATNLTFENIIFEGYGNSTSGACVNFNGTVSNIKFKNCSFYAHVSTSPLVGLGSTSQSQTMNVVFECCHFLHQNHAAILINALRATQSVPVGVYCTNCVFDVERPYTSSVSGSGAGKPGGIIFRYCWIRATSMPTIGNFSAKYPMIFNNCLITPPTPIANATGSAMVFGGNLWLNALKGSYHTQCIATSLDEGAASRRIVIDNDMATRFGSVQCRAITINQENWYRGGYDTKSGGPGTQENDTSAGNKAWSNVGNILEDDSSFATSNLSGTNDTTNYLKATNFGFTIPSNATIVNIAVRIVASSSASSTIKPNVVKLVVGGSVVGNNMVSNPGFLGTSTSALIYEGSPSTWGVTVTPDDINNANFGVVYQAIFAAASGSATANVDSIFMYVTYRLPAGHSDLPTADFYRRPRPTTLLPTVGPFDVHDHGVIQSAVARSGAALKLTGPGDHEFLVPVESGNITVSVYARYDSAHGSDAKPQLVVLSDQCGVSPTTATMTADADTWEQLSVTVNAQKAGLLTVRLVSRAQSANGNAYFDDFSVS